MNAYKHNARWAGILLILGTAAGFASLPFLGSLNAPDYLTAMAKVPGQVTLVGFLVFCMGISCAGIAIALYPVLKKAGHGMALGAVGFRLIEGVLQVVGAILVIALLTLSRESAAAGSIATMQPVGAALMAAFHWAGSAAATTAWCIGALLYYVLFYRSKLVPRWLSLWGIIGIILSMASSLLVMLHIVGTDDTITTLLHMPIMPQELVLAVWLIVKGFHKPALASLEAARA